MINEQYRGRQRDSFHSPSRQRNKKSTNQTERKKMKTQGTTYMWYSVPQGLMAAKLNKLNFSTGKFIFSAGSYLYPHQPEQEPN